jgi:nicotinamide-nucleotide adenylyltransferase
MIKSTPIDETGVIHGRFQVLHNDHLKYLLAGMDLCRHLVVGITNPDPFLTREEHSDPARSNPLANPLTYYERYIMLKTVLRDAGLDSRQFSVVPLPINLPERYKYYVPMDAVFFLSIYDDWGRRKLSYFRSLGLKTHVLWEVRPEEKGISACDIRRSMISGEPWEHLVPPGVPPLMRKWNVPLRLQKIQESA